jgi:hypothetical protein
VNLNNTSLTVCGINRAAEILRKSAMAVYQDVAHHRVPFRKLGKRLIFFEEELFQMLRDAPGVRLEDIKR